MLTEVYAVTKKGREERFDCGNVRLCAECADDAIKNGHAKHMGSISQSGCQGCGQSAEA